MRTFGKRDGGGRRKASRQNLPMPALVSTIENNLVGVLVDLSSTGARLRGSDLPPVGEVISVKIDCVRAFGIVAWSAKGECGISFDAPLSDFELRRLRHEVKLASLTWHSVDERLAFEDWTAGVAR